MASFARQTAMITRLADVRSGEWVQQPGLAPSGVKTSRGLLARVNIVGAIVEKESSSFMIEDGSCAMRVRSFDPAFSVEDLGVGEVVMLIGRPREYNGERYVALEMCRPLDKGWVAYRQKELEHLSPERPKDDIRTKAPDRTMHDAESLVARIRELDSGKGAPTDQVLEGVPSAEALLRGLLEEGEVFEIRPGMLKVLE